MSSIPLWNFLEYLEISRFFWKVISYVVVIVQIVTNRCKFKFKRENYEVCMIWSILRSARDKFS